MLVGTSEAFRHAGGRVDKAGVRAGRARDQRIAQIDLPFAWKIDVVEIIEVNTMCAAVGEFDDRVGGHLALQSQTPELGLRYVDIKSESSRNSTGGRKVGGPGWPKGPFGAVVTK